MTIHSNTSLNADVRINELEWPLNLPHTPSNMPVLTKHWTIQIQSAKHLHVKQ